LGADQNNTYKEGRWGRRRSTRGWGGERQNSMWAETKKRKELREKRERKVTGEKDESPEVDEKWKKKTVRDRCRQRSPEVAHLGASITWRPEDRPKYENRGELQEGTTSFFRRLSGKKRGNAWAH